MRVLFDTNVILDVLLARDPHADHATLLLDQVARKKLAGLVCATSITTIFYLANKAVGTTTARRHVHTLLNLFEVASISRPELSDALDLGFKDYEDAVLHEAARHARATGIVTRDAKGFARAKLTIYQPAELLKLLRVAE